MPIHNMEGLYPIIRRVRRPLVVGNVEVPLVTAHGAPQAAAPADPVVPQPEKTHDVQAASNHPAGQPAKRPAKVA
jgi:hypothetical protein